MSEVLVGLGMTLGLAAGGIAWCMPAIADHISDRKRYMLGVICIVCLSLGCLLVMFVDRDNYDN